MRRRVQAIEGTITRLETGSSIEAWTAQGNVVGWSRSWRDTLTAEEQLALADWALQWYRLAGEEGPSAEADTVMLTARIRPYLAAERAYIERAHPRASRRHSSPGSVPLEGVVPGSAGDGRHGAQDAREGFRG